MTKLLEPLSPLKSAPRNLNIINNIKIHLSKTKDFDARQLPKGPPHPVLFSKPIP